MGLYYNGKKVRNLYFNGKCITRLALGKEMTRLVEGDDFVRAEWLVGDGTAYINTLHNTNEDLDWEVKVANFTDYKCLFWQREGDVTNNLNTVLVKAVNYYPGLRVGNKSSEVRINPFSDTEIIASTSGDTITINGQPYQVTKGSSTAFGNFALFYTAFHNDSTTQDVKCAYFRFVDANGTTIQDLTPCRLLRPIPAALDANGIARNAGECGMYDSVSGKFFGNVAASGAFTVYSLVEGVDYEVHRWLVGDGSAYLYLGEVQNYIEFDVDLQQEKTDIFIYGYNGQIRYGYNGQTITVLAPKNRIKYYNVPLQGTIRIDFSTHYIYFNGEQFGHTDLGTLSGENDENCFKKAYFFGFEKLSSFRSRYFSLGNVNMDGSNFTPCRLLRPIPATLDANGIARNADECGMYNSVNGLFYGNVGSGSFTVSDN